MACRATAAVLISISLVGLAGCGSKQSVLPQDGPSMLDIYYGHFEGRPPAPEAGREDNAAPGKAAGGGRQGRERALGVARTTLAERGDESDLALVGYTRTVATETKALFPPLGNPEIVLYVFPHLAGPERLPVPGYSTVFPLYPRTEYALPGETLLPRPPADNEFRAPEPDGLPRRTVQPAGLAGR
jgi:conjugative transfer region lipoprotein (TIGR03751 family)